MLRPLYNQWFRTEVFGVEHLPKEGGRSSSRTTPAPSPLDALMLSVAVHDETSARRHLRLLGADLVFRLPVLSEMARKSGATLACNPDAERLLGEGELVGVFPEGFKGIGKPFAERYKLQRFGRGGFVSAAVRTGTPIVPVSIVGAEEIYPLIGNLRPLARPAGRPVLPGHADLPVARARSAWCRCRASGSSSSASRSRPWTSSTQRTTRWWCSTSPTRSARPSSRRSTSSWTAAPTPSPLTVPEAIGVSGCRMVPVGAPRRTVW